MAVREIAFGPYVVTVGSEDKIFFPKSKITKGALIDYYQRIASTMIPYIKDRPLTMMRYPNGISQEGFYQKDAASYFPDWIERVPIKKKDGGIVQYVICNNAVTLLYIANQGSITQHIWLSRKDKLAYPDRMVFDLDPSKKDFTAIRKTALQIKEILEQIGLKPFVMTTGSRGLHVVTPIKREKKFVTVKRCARAIAKYVVLRNPNVLTLEVRKNKRKGRIFVDILRNEYAQTGVAPYSVRAKEGAPVATPLSWHEVRQSSLRSDKYTIKNIFKRLARKEDPWKGIDRHARSIVSAQKKIQQMLSREKTNKKGV